MANTTNDRLIINSPYEEPGQYWSYDRESRLFDRKAGRIRDRLGVLQSL
jgi:type III restriction enzyme